MRSTQQGTLSRLSWKAMTLGAFSALAWVACGGPLVGDMPAKPLDCTDNADCASDAVCVEGTCVAVGQCIVDQHCNCDAPHCVNHACVGPSLCENTPPTVCTINAECTDKTFCIQGVCMFSTECVSNLDCPTGKPCFLGLCWDLGATP